MSHPYFPRDIVLPHYKPNANSTAEILAIFFGVAGLVILSTWRLTSRQSTGDRVKICWFVVCGLIHMILEGYFSVFHATIAGRNSYLAQMCKYIFCWQKEIFLIGEINGGGDAVKVSYFLEDGLESL